VVRILIADDSPPVSTRASHFAGTEFRLARSAAKLWTVPMPSKRRDSFAPDLILMDFSMPQMDGVQAAYEITKTGKRHTDPALHSESFQLRSWNWLAKLVFVV